MLRPVRTILLVALVTALVWFFAESKTLRRSRATAVVSVAGAHHGEAPPARILTLADPRQPTEFPVALTLEGPSGVMEEAERASQRVVILTPGTLDIPEKPGEYTLRLADVLAQSPALRERGVRVLAAEPPELRVSIDDAASAPALVEVIGEDGTRFPSAAANVGTVRVSLPRSHADKLTGTLVARAVLSKKDVERLVPGRPETVTGVPVLPPDGLQGIPGACVSPGRVDVAVTLRARTTEHTLRSVPVHVRLAPDELSRWDVTIPEEDRALLDVKVSGPADLVQQIKDRTLPVVAVVPLSFEDLERGISSKDALFTDLPTPLRFEAKKTTVRLVIKRRD
jgi:hypothetical protein